MYLHSQTFNSKLNYSKRSNEGLLYNKDLTIINNINNKLHFRFRFLDIFVNSLRKNIGFIKYLVLNTEFIYSC